MHYMSEAVITHYSNFSQKIYDNNKNEFSRSKMPAPSSLFGLFFVGRVFFYTFHHLLPFPKVSLHTFLFIPERTYMVT